MARSRKKRWSKIITEHGVELRLYERAGTSAVWYSVMVDGKKKRGSLKTDDREQGEIRARAIATELAEARITGADLRCGVTLGQDTSTSEGSPTSP